MHSLQKPEKEVNLHKFSLSLIGTTDYNRTKTGINLNYQLGGHLLAQQL